MSFKTNVWEDGVRFNGVVHPMTAKQIKEFTDKNPSILPSEKYTGKITGNCSFDLQSKSLQSQKQQWLYISEIDRLRAVDVPIKLYSVGYVILLIVFGVGVYIAQTSYQFSGRNLAAVICGGFVILTLCFVLMTYCGFASEEKEDTVTLCFLQNKIKKETNLQLNYQRLNMKLNDSNWGRTEKEITDIFLMRVNQMRGQANALLMSPTMFPADDFDTMTELVMRLHTRFHEICFENAGLLKRLYHQLNGVEDWKAAGSDCTKQMLIIREVFAMHLAIRLFGGITNFKMLSLLSGDNLGELIKKCSALTDDSSFQDAVARASGCTAERVATGFKCKYDNPKDCFLVLKSLNEVYMGLIEKFPKRQYERVMDASQLEDPEVDEKVSF